MSTTVDQRVVEMRFDNKQFESNVSTTMSTLDKLKQSLNLKGASQGLEAINDASKKCDMSVLGNAIETVHAKFSALQVIGTTALVNITNAAINTGKQMVEALTLNPVMTGFQEYETQINAVQTILANTSSKGTTLDNVNDALDELNKYADLTIYNFTEMTRNIGTFTAAGVDLDTSVSAIQGIANLAAVSGSTSQQASTAMYQLSQALATGTVKLMDWNSVVNAGMGGEVFQNALKETSELLGTGAEAAIEAEGSFRESLQTGWLTSEVLTETLKKFTTSGANEYVAKYCDISVDAVEAALKEAEAQYGEADAIEHAAQALADKTGKNKDEIKSVLEMAKTAQDAATKVKTFSQLWDTLKEAAQSGWTQTWEIIVGDFEEAKELLTNISDVVSEMINKSAEARNSVLQSWKDLGGRTALIDAFKNAFEALMSVVNPIKEAFEEIIPPVTAEKLLAITNALKEFTSKLKLSDEASKNLKSTFRGLFAIVHIIGSAFSSVLKIVGSLLPAVSFLGGGILSLAGAFGEWLVKIDEAITKSGFLGGITEGIVSFIKGIGNGFKSLFNGFTTGISEFGDGLSTIGATIKKVLSTIWNGIKNVFGFITDNLSVIDIITILTTGEFIACLKEIKNLFDTWKNNSSGGLLGILFGGGDDEANPISIKTQFQDILGSVHDSLQAFTSGIKVASLVSIAVAIGILAASLKTIAGLDVPDVAKGLTAIGILFVFLTQSFKSINKALSNFNAKGIIKTGIALMLFAEAVKILTDAMVKISGLSWKEIAKGLIGVGGALLELSVAAKIINKVKIPLSTSIAILALAESCKILSDAFQKFGEMEWDEIKRGLVGMGIALGELVGVLAIVKKVGGFKSLVGSVSLLIAVQALDEISENLKKIGEMSWDEIKRGLVGLGGALTEVSGISGALGKIAGFSGLLGAETILIAVQGLGDLADAFKKFGEMSWDEIKRGLVGLGGALTEVSGISGALGKIAGFSGLLGAGIILLAVKSLGDLADAFKKFGEMSWDEIGRGLVGMGGALLEVSIISGALGYLAGLPALLGGGAILLAVQGLGDLADAFKKFGEIEWDEIQRGLVAMGVALGEVALGGLINTFSGLGASAISKASSSLGDLADAFKKFGEMEWDEIKHGLVAMGAALGEVAYGGMLNTFSGLGASAISKASTSLGTLADSVKKWSNVEVPIDLGNQLEDLADGISSFTLSGLGAGALSEAAPAIGTMADSIKKWSGVTVPEGLGLQLAGLSFGINSFTFSGLGAVALSEAAPAIGTMADSVKKWSDVIVPEGLNNQLRSLSEGVKSFTWAFMGGWSIETVVEPLGNLAESVNKWKGVSVPDDLGDQLSKLADGVQAFSWAFIGGWSLSTITGPLGDLAGSVKKWNGVSIPADLGTQLSNLATGVKSFNGATDLTVVASGFGIMASAVSKLSGVDFSYITSGLSNLCSSASDLASSSETFSSLGTNIVNGLVIPLQNGIGTVTAAAQNLINGAVSAITASSAIFSTAGLAMTQNLTKGIKAGSNTASAAMKAVINSCKTAATSSASGFWNIGYGVAEGFAKGIKSGSFKASLEASAMAQAAKEAAEKKLDINSPSKVFRKIGTSVPEGFAQGIDRMSKLVTDSTSSMATKAIASTSKALSRVNTITSDGLDIQPTITPVVNMNSVNASNIQLGANINTLLTKPVTSLSSIMAAAQDDINSSNAEVINAVNNLREDLNSLFSDNEQEISLYVDSNKLASSIVRPMNRQLNILSKREGGL